MYETSQTIIIDLIWAAFYRIQKAELLNFQQFWASCELVELYTLRCCPVKTHCILIRKYVLWSSVYIL